MLEHMIAVRSTVAFRAPVPLPSTVGSDCNVTRRGCFQMHGAMIHSYLVGILLDNVVDPLHGYRLARTGPRDTKHETNGGVPL